MRSVLFLLAVIMFVATVSFKYPGGEALVLKTGEYGVCNCNTLSTVKTELVINEDHTFRYYDNSNSNKVIDVKGNWVLKGDKVQLTNYTADFPIHKTWTIDKNEKCLKSRKGLNFTRLCHLRDC